MLEFDPAFWGNIVEKLKYLPEWIEQATSSTAPIWAVIALQYIVGRAQAINSREEAREEHKIIAEERDSVRKKVKAYASEIDAILWRGIDNLHDKVTKSGSKTIQIHHGHDTMVKSINDFRRDYHHGFSKVTPIFVNDVFDFIIEEIDSCNNWEQKKNNLDELARCERMKLVDGIHKRAGYSSEVVEMEDNALPYSIVRDMVTKIYEHAERCRVKRTSQEKIIAEKFAVDILSIVKVMKVFIRRGKK